MNRQHDQQPDTKPGFYYVTVVNDLGQKRLLSGPYPNNHRAALDDVTKASRIAQDIDSKAAFYAYGTARCDADLGPGILNQHGFMEARHA